MLSQSGAPIATSAAVNPTAAATGKTIRWNDDCMPSVQPTLVKKV